MRPLTAGLHWITPNFVQAGWGTLLVNEVKQFGASQETLRFAHSQSALRAG